LLIQNEIPKEDLDYILKPFKEDSNKKEDSKKIIFEKIIVVVRDAKGNIIEKRTQKMRSLTQYYLALMSIPLLGTYSGGTGVVSQSILQNILSLPNAQGTYQGDSAEINFDMSIQLGSGTQSFSPTLNSLASPISNGSGTGQLIYNSQSISYNSNSISQLLTVSNNTNSSITVSEIGLIGTIYLVYYNSSATYTHSSYTYLFSYDTFSSAVNIPAGGSASFQIVITFSG